MEFFVRKWHVMQIPIIPIKERIASRASKISTEKKSKIAPLNKLEMSPLNPKVKTPSNV